MSRDGNVMLGKNSDGAAKTREAKTSYAQDVQKQRNSRRRKGKECQGNASLWHRNTMKRNGKDRTESQWRRLDQRC